MKFLANCRCVVKSNNTSFLLLLLSAFMQLLKLGKCACKCSNIQFWNCRRGGWGTENKAAKTSFQDSECTLTGTTKKSSLSHGKILRESNVCCPHVHKGNSFFPKILLLNYVTDMIRQPQGLKMLLSKILFIFSLFKKHLFKTRAISCWQFLMTHAGQNVIESFF